jgi:hypothetical protein
MKDRNDKPLAKGNEGKKIAGGAVTGGVVGGVAGGATTGALAGGLTGPAGAVIGAAVGAVAGAVMGKRKADPVVEDTYWRDNYASRPYVTSGATYDDYAPAYRHGVEGYTKYEGKTYDEVEPHLERDWGTARGNSRLEWERAKHATRDAWHRVERAIPGDADGDGR